MTVRYRRPALGVALAGILCVGFSVIHAQTAPADHSSTPIQQVTPALKGEPPTGPYPVVVEHDQTLATHTIYRPAKLGPSKHPVVVWGEGACAKDGLQFPEFLTEIASHGFVIIADGPPVGRTLPGGAGAPQAREGGPAAPRAGDALPPAPRAGAAGPGRGGPPAVMTDGTALITALDWLSKEANDRGSRFYQKVDVAHVAAMGMSCGGLMSYGASADPRIATVGIWNSGLIQPDAKIFAGLHSPVIIVTGGEKDIAYANGKRDFETMPAKIPVFYGVYPSVGHGGTYNEDNGGAFGVTAVAWLKWQLMNDTSAKGKGYFVGSGCQICSDPKWQTASRGLR